MKKTSAAAVLGAAALAMAAAVSNSPAGANTVTFSADAPTLKVTKTSVTTYAVTASQTTRASVPTTVSDLGICVRSVPGGEDLDYPWQSSATLGTAGTTFTATKSLETGRYTFFNCFKYNGAWTGVSTATTTLDVAAAAGASSPAPAPTATPAPTGAATPTSAVSSSGSSMPVGNLNGWKQVFTEDFTEPAALGSWPGPSYSGKWFPYGPGTDTSGHGTYNAAKTMSVSGGILNANLHTAGSTAYVSAAIAAGAPWAQTYGRYSVRMRVPAEIRGYKIVGILWPDSNNWEEGEIDYPEVNNLVRGEEARANVYHGGGSSSDANWSHRTTSTAIIGGWHTYTIEWKPRSLAFFVDGTQQGATVTSRVPSHPMHWVLQYETAISSSPPAAGVSGNVQVDWAVAYAYSPNTRPS